jgi:CRISPR system Cascade subunit CasE
VSDDLFLSRLRLREDATVRAIAPLLLAEGGGERLASAHKLLWALFADTADRRRDFLWREDSRGVFLVLSRRPPSDAHGLFDLDHKPFAPALVIGDRLRFRLRANAVVAGPASRGTRGTRRDVVMARLHPLPSHARAAARDGAVREAAHAWLARQGEAAGFTVSDGELAAEYDRLTLPRPTGRPAVFGVLDLEGVLEVRHPTLLLSRTAEGFGRARAFGCGLLLIRRAR